MTSFGEIRNMDKPKATIREVLSCAVLVIVIGAFFVLNFVLPAPEILVAERRIPAKFPELSVSSVFSGNFMSKFDDYAADRFVFRDAFRGINAFLVFDLLMQRDMSGLYRSKNIGLGEFRATNASVFRQSAQKVKNAAESFAGLDMRIYYTLIPDKSIFAEYYMPGFDLGLSESILNDVLDSYTRIDIAGMLEPGDYYRTDLHWNQRKIYGAASHMLISMGADPLGDIHTESSAGSFYGLYAGQIALPADPDILLYTEIPGLRASYLNEKTLEFESGPIYDFERFEGVDPYDIFLRGPQPLIVLENDNAPGGELYLFRDSFGSSLAPLLACSYSKVTIIDLRYINLLLLDMFIDFTPGSDVLFIYGSQIFNNPSVLQA